MLNFFSILIVLGISIANEEFIKEIKQILSLGLDENEIKSRLIISVCEI